MLRLCKLTSVYYSLETIFRAVAFPVVTIITVIILFNLAAWYTSETAVQYEIQSPKKSEAPKDWGEPSIRVIDCNFCRTSFELLDCAQILIVGSLLIRVRYLVPQQYIAMLLQLVNS